MRTNSEYARELDDQDELACFRNEFVIEDPDLIYLDGNSLGRLPKRSAERVRQAVEGEWGGRMIRGWNEGWFDAPRRIGAKIAHVIGAEEDEVIVGDSTSVVLFKCVLGAIQARPQRRKIITDDLNFPSDIYVTQSAARLRQNCHVEIVRSPDAIIGPEGALKSSIDHETALVALTHTAFKSGFVYDMEGLTRATHDAGAIMLWDLCHSAGAMPLSLGACGVDVAVGCTYKYLNGGPGAPAFLYVRREAQKELVNPLWGWFGQEGQFDFGLEYRPAAGIRQFLTGTPSIVSLASVETGVELILEAGLDRIRKKSVMQTEYLVALWEAFLKPLGVTLNSPRDPIRRGSHVSLGHPEGMRIDRALIEDMNVIPDFRYPDNIRLGVVPLYTTFSEIWQAITRMKTVIADKLYEKYPLQRPEVT